MTLHVCFVCTGNICRSPMAEKVFVEHLRRAGLADRVRVSSAGTGPWHIGQPADPRTDATLTAAGYPTGHVAAQLGAAHADADLFVAMDIGHESALSREFDADRVRLLRSFDPALHPRAEPDVPDPYYADDGFGEVLDMIEAAMPGLLDWVRERL